jgi:predicted acyltransferase
VLFTAGMAAVSLATIMWIVDFQKIRGWTRPFVIYGINPIIDFIGSGVMARLIYSIIKVDSDGKRIPLQAWLYQTFFASWLSPVNASLAFAVAFVLFWYGILYVLYRKNIILKV